MNMWNHLFLDGEFIERERLLAGLTLDQVTCRPPGASHSIYEELWHATTWQNIVVDRDEAGGESWFGGGPDFPSEVPIREAAWHDLVTAFLDGAARAAAWGERPEQLEAEVDGGVTLADALHSLAVHNAYHLGKIVALRQMIGAWPPPPR
jgi:uncharacterized damage-inducible protein DinB